MSEVNVATLEAPALAGSRSHAQQLVADLPQDLSDVVVLLDCRQLLAATASFADELVRVILSDRGAAELRIVGADADPEFVDDVKARAEAHGTAGRLYFDA